MKIDSPHAELQERVASKYPLLTEARFAGEMQRIQYMAQSTRDLLGKRILDLGCGSNVTKDTFFGFAGRLIQRYIDPVGYARFQPWYCRILHEAGASAVGVDIASNAKETFESHQLDLMDPTALDQFPDESFDGVNNYFLSVPRDSVHAKVGTSPAIMKALAWKHHREDLQDFQKKGIPLDQWSAEMRKRSFPRMHAINDQIFSQVQRLLKNGGTYTLAEFVYQKKKGSLKRTQKMEGI